MEAATPIILPPKTFRGKMNNIVLIIAFVLAFMVVNTRTKCIKAEGVEDFKDSNEVKWSFMISVAIIIFCLGILGYDLAKMVKLI
jgi:heme/copper-type cytochrome/quinol oxidase subunit 2